MKLIAGLGNPGRTYARHRHNVGFLTLDELARRHGIEMRKRSFGALIGSGSIDGESVLLAKPETYMNLSGESVGPLLGYYRLGADSLIVVHDDLDIDLGRMKLARAAGHGGHNGVRSIMETTGTGDFTRVRIGIGRPPVGMDGANYVLAPFTEQEQETISEAIMRAADAVEMIISEGLAKAQQKYH
ncbi:MAG: aminoacyl-tRNA hydrolase [bacterium]